VLNHRAEVIHSIALVVLLVTTTILGSLLHFGHDVSVDVLHRLFVNFSSARVCPHDSEKLVQRGRDRDLEALLLRMLALCLPKTIGKVAYLQYVQCIPSQSAKLALLLLERVPEQVHW
jgi:hypothetical protein